MHPLAVELPTGHMVTLEPSHDPRSLLQQKEQELTKLRETALSQLEAEASITCLHATPA